MNRVISFLCVLIPATCGAANSARHFSYSGNDPAQWSSSAIVPVEAAAATDFAVFPCSATRCTVARVITDANRNTYAVGSRIFGTDNTGAPVSDVFVAKLDPGGATIFLVTIGGKGSDQGLAVALDPTGDIFVGGSTTSPNFPMRNAVQSQLGNGVTGFLVKLSPDGSQLIYSSYFGGTRNTSFVNAVAADGAGNAYVTGQTGSTDFPVSPGMPAGTVTGWPVGISGAFVAKVAASGDRILYSGVIAGSLVACTGDAFCSIGRAVGLAIAVDAAGNAYLAGGSNVWDLPTTPGALARQGVGAWVARINASGAKMDYLTYLGAMTYRLGSQVSIANWIGGLAVDGVGNAYLAGTTNDPRFPATPGAFQSTYHSPVSPPPIIGYNPPSDAFVAKLNPQGTAMVYATFLGGSDYDGATGIAVDSTGAAYVTGTTYSTNFPVTSTASKGQDFIAVLNPAGSALSFASRYPGNSVSQAIAVDADGRLRTASSTGTVSSLALNSAPGTRLFGITSATGGLLGPSVAPGEVVSLFGSQLVATGGATAQPDNTGKMPTALAGTQVLFDGVAAPLLYVSQDQVNAVSPFGLSPGKVTTVRIIAGNARSPDFQGIVIPSRPAVFYAAALNQDGTVNTGHNPAKLGSVVTTWVTGIGSVFPAPPDGQVATVARDYYCCTVNVIDNCCTIIPKNKPAEVLYSGAAPGMVAGVVQVNFRVPSDLVISSGTQSMTFSVAVSSPALDQPPPPASSIWVSR